MHIPIFDLTRQYQQIQGELSGKLEAVLAGGVYILGENVAALEEEFARHCRTAHAVGVASGTDALKIALRAIGVGPGDEVITTPFTFIATAEAVHNAGARIVFADISLDSYNINPEEIKKRLTPRTKVVICVHLYGQPCAMEEIEDIAGERGLQLIEDCAQATGAEYKGKKIGSFGIAGCFSFYPTKNLGAFGDGGMIVTDDNQLAERMKMLRAHGSAEKFLHTVHGMNSRLDEVQAAVLRVKLKYLDEWNGKRRELAQYYNESLFDLEEQGFLVRPQEKENTRHVYHLYILRVKHRAEMMRFLETRGIGTSYHYPLPLHLQQVYKDLGYSRGSFPQAETAADEVVTFPLYPELEKKEIDYISDALHQFFKVSP